MSYGRGYGMGGSVPAGDDWHRELLDQVAIGVPNIRPAALTAELRGSLDLPRRFRHLERHAYAAEYGWQEMQSVLAAAGSVLERLPNAIDRVDAWLQQTIDRL